MDNYLKHRWPQGPGNQPPPVPSGPARRSRTEKKRSLRRWAVPLVSVVLCLSLLGGICFWAVNGIADIVAQAKPTLPDDPRPWVSRYLDSSGSDWSPHDLPWEDPDPSVSLSVRAAGPVLSGREAYQAALPTLVCVEAAHADRFEGASVGTGVVVTQSGYVVTNYHIIDETVSIQVVLMDGTERSFEAGVIGFDEDFDLAVLKFDPGNAELTPAQLGDSDELMVGDHVYAVGNPMGYLTGSMSTGIVSALDRELDQNNSKANGSLGLIQTDAPLNPGNSGGALLNTSGQVVGITCAKITGLSRETGDAVEDAVVIENIGLAIPITDAIPFLNHILATGKSWRPAIGIQCSAVEMDGRRGIRVAEVTGEAPREAGLRKDDLIIAANGTEVATLVELRRVLYRTGVDGELTCTVLRNGEERQVTFALTDSLEEN